MKTRSVVSLAALGILLAACGAPPDLAAAYAEQAQAVSPCSAPIPPPSCTEGGPVEGGPRDAGTSDAGVADAGSTTTTSTQVVPEPSFNGGFDERYMGKCEVRDNGSVVCSGDCYPQPDGTTACDWITSLPTGWWLSAPRDLRDWGRGIYAPYGSGRTYSTPHPHFPLFSSNSSLAVAGCLADHIDYNGRNCSLAMSIVSSRFAVVPGAVYRLSYWYYAFKFMASLPFDPTPIGLTVNVHWYSATGAFISLANHDVQGLASPPSMPKPPWTETGRLVTAPAGAIYAEVQVVTQPLDRDVSVDDIRLIPQQ